LGTHRPLALLAPVLAAALLLAGCGGSGGGMQDMEGMEGEGGGRQGQAEKKEAGNGGGGGMEGMDMGGGNATAADEARDMVEEDGRYSDERFIDAMVPHHQGAVEMAEVALENAEHREIRDLAEDVVTAQEAEIEELRAIKEKEYGTSEIPSVMDQRQIDAMGMTDPQELAERRPFDKAFIDSMIPHHESAIAMANAALDGGENPEIREIARAIVEAQKKEITQMEAWRREWYPTAA
jgi:uncharacterized protein (DUF305 family)